ncbi:MAG: tetratricopeptide repeat protein [Marinilabiliales bacterium]|nr:tetratricopeptide repeat protein [Marinilabiliales bacterium]
MATFYYNWHSSESIESQWGRYIQTQAYIRDIRSSVKQQTKEFNDAIQSASKDNVTAIQQSTGNICGTLERGFEQISDQMKDVSWRLNEINEGLGRLYSMLDWKTDLMIEELKISNLYLGNIAKLLKIPDSQKQRSYHVEQGLIYLKNAIAEGAKSDFYKDALGEFQKAKAIEEKDFFTLHRLGLIHLNSVHHLDVAQAERYFSTSARYAKAFGSVQPVNTQTILRGNAGHNYYETYFDTTLFEEASTSLIYASRCCYILQKFSEGINYADQAFKLTPNNPEAGLQLAKMLAASGNPTMAAEVLEQVIKINRYYAVKAITDLDLITKPPIQSKLNEITQRTLTEAKNKYNECKKLCIAESQASAYLQTIHQNLSQNDFLGAKKALDQFNEKRKWYLYEYSVNKETVFETPQMRELITRINSVDDTIYHFIQKEAEQYKAKIEITKYINHDFVMQTAIADKKKRDEVKSLIRTVIIVIVIIGIFLFASGIYGLNTGLGFAGGILEILKWVGAIIVVIIIIIVAIAMMG